MRLKKSQLNDKDIKLLSDFSSLNSLGWLNRRKILFRYKIFKTGLRRNIGMFLVI